MTVLRRRHSAHGGKVVAAALQPAVPGVFTPVPIPSAPSFTSPVTRVNDNFLQLSELGGATDIIMDGAATSIYTQDLVGTPGTPYRIRNNDADFVAGDASAGEAIRVSGAGDYIEYYGLSPEAPLRLEGSGKGMKFPSSASPGSHYLLQNAVIQPTTGSGTLNNDGTQVYGSRTMRFVRVFGAGTEGLYEGKTDKAAGTYDLTIFSDYEDILINDCRWDGAQFNGHGDLNINRMTIINAGTSNQGGQRNLIQVENGRAVIKNSLFYGAPVSMNINCHDILWENCVFIYDGTAPGTWGRYETNYPAPDYLNVGGTGTYKDCYFHALTPGTFINIIEDRINVSFVNPRTTANVTLYSDSRADASTYSINLSGETSWTYEAPTFESLLAADYTTHGVLSNQFYQNLGVGYRTPGGVA